jgi:phospholipase D1/2
MMEHFGLSYNDVLDPIAARDKINQLVAKNTMLYQEIFKSEPDNSIANFGELQQLRTLRESEQSYVLEFTQKYLQLKDQIIGHAVEYPVYFLKEERLGQSIVHSEILVPEICFV